MESVKILKNFNLLFNTSDITEVFAMVQSCVFSVHFDFLVSKYFSESWALVFDSSTFIPHFKAMLLILCYNTFAPV